MAYETEHRVDYNRERKADAPKGADAAATRILGEAKTFPNDRSLAIAAKCLSCKSTSAGVRGCKDGSCPLHKLRPFQMDVAPVNKPRVKHCSNDIEVPVGTDPSEPDESEVDDG